MNNIDRLPEVLAGLAPGEYLAADIFRLLDPDAIMGQRESSVLGRSLATFNNRVLGMKRFTYVGDGSSRVYRVRLVVPGALALIAQKRAGQVAKGYDAKHDDLHEDGQLAGAGLCFLMAYVDPNDLASAADIWPFEVNDDDGPKFGTPLENLVNAAALLEAEIDRIQRLAEKVGVA